MPAKFLSILLLALAFNANAQNIESKIDTSNYYDFYIRYAGSGCFYAGNPTSSLQLTGKQITTAWLSTLEVTPIIIEELELAGYQYPAYNAILKLDSNQVLLLNTYCDREKFGILYLQGHDAEVSPKHRQIKTPLHLRPGIAYVEKVFNTSGNAEFLQLKSLPSNVLRLSENCYWYQFTDSDKDQKKMINKDLAIKLLRSDIRALLATAPKPVVVEEKPFFFKMNKTK